MMDVIQEAEAARRFCRKLRSTGSSLGFVPTMGALHEGHMSLIRRSVQENDYTVVSIFINPTQFNDANDYSEYPQPIEDDIRLLKNTRIQMAFCPKERELYPDDYRYRLQETSFSKELEGAHRPGHFDGVLTVVMKLLNIVSPNRAYFGEKDWQQYLLIHHMAKAFFMQTEIVPCPLVRDSDGLALSSRNALLSKHEREIAPLLHEALVADTCISDKRKTLTASGFDVEYVEERDGRILAAAKLGSVRLIDNVEVRRRKQ